MYVRMIAGTEVLEKGSDSDSKDEDDGSLEMGWLGTQVLLHTDVES